MKRIVTLLIALILVITMSACGVETNEPVQSESDDISSVLLDENESDSEDTATTSSIEESSEETSTDDGWRDFLKEYEEWADKYIAVVKKYKSNPSDLSILTEYTSLITELADWTERADDLSNSIVDVKDAAEYSAELVRIAAKIAEAAGDL
ncbi:MAG: hypothetical protein IIW94_04550 [Clostridia bacterium]|nr:hypothetical protein [Clostridia bacterium]